MASSSVVIKVKYGKTLRRFSALVNEDGLLDLDMERLRAKICSLFDFTPDADFTLTYVDEDDDQVTLADDEDLYDVMKQGLNPVRITVRLNVDKSGQSSAKSTGSSTPKRSTSQNSQAKNPCVAEIWKSVPGPLCDVLSKLSHELASKAVTTSPVLADLISNLSQVGQAYLNVSGTATVRSHEVHGGNQNTSATEKRVASVDEGMKHDGVQGSASEQSAPTSSEVSGPHAVKGSRQAETVKPPQRLPCLLRKCKKAHSRHFHCMPVGDVIKKEKEIIGDSAGKCKANTDSTKLPTGDSWNKDKEIKGDSAGVSQVNVFEGLEAQLEKHVSPKQKTNEANSSENNGFNWSGSSGKSAFDSYPMGESAFSGVPLQSTLGHAPYMPPPIQPFKSHYNDSAYGVGFIFHKGVRCDGCGVLPITGPRFKSKVRHDYDLCSICFSRTGNDADYARIDFPLPDTHPSFKRFYDPMVTHLPTMQIPSVMRPYGVKHLRSRLDSRFIMDVNVMDGTLMAPSTPFTKIWRMRNNGTLPWVRGLQLLWIGGDRFSASDSFEIEIPVEGVNVSDEIDVAVDFIAPELPGRYISYWRMADATGHKFGQRVWVLIQVDVPLKDSVSESSPVLKPSLPSGKVGSMNHESSPVVDLNLPPGNGGFSGHESSLVVNLNLDVNAEPTGDIEAGDLSSAPEGGKLSAIAQKEKIEIVDMNFPINDDLLVASGVGSSPITTASSSNPSSVSDNGDSQTFSVATPQVSYPEMVPNFQHEQAKDVSSALAASSSLATSSSMPSAQPMYPMPLRETLLFSYPVVDTNVQPKPASATPSISYPIVDVSEKSSSASSSAANNDGDKTNSDQVSGVKDVEENLLKELDEMGFKQAELNKEVLRMNGYDLERSVDELCGVSEWDPILEELQEMGFHDNETNRKLLVKNNGSIMRVVMDLVAGEKA